MCRLLQLVRLLENQEIVMIHSVRRKLAQEMTLVTAERTREESGLPVDLWKKSVSLLAGGGHLVC